MKIIPCLFAVLSCVFFGPTLHAEVESRDALNTWLLLGTFDNDTKNTGFERAWINETNILPQEGLSSGGKKWTYFDDRMFSRNYDDYQDLLSYYKIKRGESVTAKVVYAHTYVYSPKEVKGLLHVGADSQSQVWLNGEPVLKTVMGEWRKDSVSAPVTLNEGWNRLLLKVSNKQDARLGFYARFSTKRGQPLEGLVWSVGGPTSELKVASSSMPDASTGSMPVGWREWPYVGARPDPALIFPAGSAVDEEKWSLYSFVRVGDNFLHASDFLLQAQGGTPPYRWSVAGGELPPGLTLESDGRLKGVVSKDAEEKTYAFTARVKDSTGALARKELAIEVKERPNKAYEEARLVALIHAPEFLTDQQIEEMAVLMKRQGYQIGMPVSYNNGELEFRWPSPFAPEGTRDTVGKFKEALERNGIQFGMYMGNLNLDPWPKARFGGKEQHLMLEEAIRKYRPVALWFDWPTRDGEALDALYSMVRAIDPNLTIVLNGASNGSNGDWDQISFEGWGAWGWNMWGFYPVEIPWPKKHSPESWRMLTDPTGPEGRELLPSGPALNSESDWQEFLRVQLAMIGEGFVADIDHSATLRKQKLTDLSESPLIQYHTKMGEWASPRGLPPLYPSFTQVNPGPLDVAPWGYNLINTAQDTIYLHILRNARGKTGMPPEKTLTVGPVEGKVKSATWMNKNRPLSFTQNLTSTDKRVTVNIEGVEQDPIDTIIKLELEAPLVPALKITREPTPAGNLASFKPSRLLGFNGSTSLLPSSGNLARFGNDGNPETAAVAGGEYAWTYEVDLERVFPVSKVALQFGPRGFATEYEVLLSDDGEEWVSVAKGQGKQAGSREVSEFPAKEARYVRVRALKPDGPKQDGIQMAVGELEVYE